MMSWPWYTPADYAELEEQNERLTAEVKRLKAQLAAQPGPREVVPEGWSLDRIFRISHDGGYHAFLVKGDGIGRGKWRDGKGATYQEAIAAALAQDSGYE